jgi:hypothetical protein
MADHSAGHISTKEALEMVTKLKASLGGPGVKFYPG